jgi:trans-2,3-dihydro-3-hydroxyanthranilate isomerase
VQKANVDIAAFKQYFATRGNSLGMPLFVFCRQTVHRQNQVHARMFAPTFGIAEDPATGSANACLAAYVLKHGYFGPDKTVLNPATNKTSNPVSYKVEQGFEMGRPSLLHVRAEISPMSIQVGGQVVDVAEGRLL